MKSVALLLGVFGGTALAAPQTCVCSHYVRQADGLLRAELVEVYRTSDAGRIAACTSLGTPWLRDRKILPSYFDCKATEIIERESALEWTFPR